MTLEQIRAVAERCDSATLIARAFRAALGIPQPASDSMALGGAPHVKRYRGMRRCFENRRRVIL